MKAWARALFLTTQFGAHGGAKLRARYAAGQQQKRQHNIHATNLPGL